jgi:hypothetical protein
MTISSNKIEDIMREYVRNITPAKREAEEGNSTEPKPVKDNVTISDDGKKKMRERFQDDILSYLRRKY